MPTLRLVDDAPLSPPAGATSARRPIPLAAKVAVSLGLTLWAAIVLAMSIEAVAAAPAADPASRQIRAEQLLERLQGR